MLKMPIDIIFLFDDIRSVRTTLALDDDVLEKVKCQGHER